MQLSISSFMVCHEAINEFIACHTPDYILSCNQKTKQAKSV